MTHDTSKETGEPSNPRFRAAEKWDTFLCPAKGGKPPEDMLSTIIIEELAEVLVEISKIRRFGIDGFHPHEPETSNRLRLSREVGDVLGVLDMMIQHGMVEGKAIQPMDGHPPPYHDCIPPSECEKEDLLFFSEKKFGCEGKKALELAQKSAAGMIKIRIHEATNLVISKLIHALSQRLIYMPPWNPVPLPSLPHDSVNLCFRDLRWLFGKLAEVSYIDLITVEKHRKEKPDRIKQFQKDSMEGVDYWGSTPPPS